MVVVELIAIALAVIVGVCAHTEQEKTCNEPAGNCQRHQHDADNNLVY